MLIAFLLIAATVATADHAEDRATLPLAEVVALARERNPRLAAARARARAAGYVPARVSALEDPVLSWEAWNAPESFNVARADNNIFRVSQRLPFPGKLGATRDEAHRAAETAGFEADAIEVEVVADARKALADLWRAHEELHVYQRDLDLVRSFTRVSERKYGLGEAAQTDVLRSQVELTRLVNRVETTKLALESAAARLNVILSRPPAEALGRPEEPALADLPSDPALLVTTALERRPDLRARRADVAMREAALRVARLSPRPDFEVAFGRFFNHGAADGFGAMASVTLPFAYGGKYDAAIGEADATLAAARGDVRRLEDRIGGEIAEALVAARSAKLRRDLFLGTHVPQAGQALRAAASGYETGAVDFTAWIETFRDLEAVHLEHAEASAMLGSAAADLERAIGGSLDETLAALAAPMEKQP